MNSHAHKRRKAEWYRQRIFLHTIQTISNWEAYEIWTGTEIYCMNFVLIFVTSACFVQRIHNVAVFLDSLKKLLIFHKCCNLNNFNLYSGKVIKCIYRLKQTELTYHGESCPSLLPWQSCLQVSRWCQVSIQGWCAAWKPQFCPVLQEPHHCGSLLDCTGGAPVSEIVSLSKLFKTDWAQH